MCYSGYCVNVVWMCLLWTLMAGPLSMLQHTGVRGRPVASLLNSCAIWRLAVMRYDL